MNLEWFQSTKFPSSHSRLEQSTHYTSHRIVLCRSDFSRFSFSYVIRAALLYCVRCSLEIFFGVWHLNTARMVLFFFISHFELELLYSVCNRLLCRTGCRRHHSMRHQSNSIGKLCHTWLMMSFYSQNCFTLFSIPALLIHWFSAFLSISMTLQMQMGFINTLVHRFIYL